MLARLLARLSRPSGQRGDLTPLWHRTVEIAREPHWYAQAGVADTVAGRFDMITAVLALVLLRLEREGEAEASVRLTEMFVDDMDGQLRESGVGDLMVGKRMGTLMSALGGRLGAYREALAAGDAELAAAVRRNVTLVAPDDDGTRTARALRGLAADIDSADRAALLSGRIERSTR